MSNSLQENTIAKQEAMLKALQELHGSVTKAAEKVHITRQAHYNWYKNDEAYRDKVDILKYVLYEEYKELVLEAALKKITEGNTSVINRSFQTFFAKWAEQMERANPYRPRLVPKLTYIDKPRNA